MTITRLADTPLSADSEVISFQSRMLSKGRVFYGVAVMPPKGMESEVKGKLEAILSKHGQSANMADIQGYIVFGGELLPHSIEDIRQYLTSIEHITPKIPVIKRGDYFQMAAYKWLDGILQRQKFN